MQVCASLRLRELSRDYTVTVEGQEVPVYHVQGVTFKDIRATAAPLQIELNGFDEAHAVEDVFLQDVVVNGKALVQADVKTNAFTRNVRVQP